MVLSEDGWVLSVCLHLNCHLNGTNNRWIPGLAENSGTMVMSVNNAMRIRDMDPC